MGVGEETAQTLLQATSKATLITADVILAAIRSLNKVLSKSSIKANNVNKSTSTELQSGKQSIQNLSKHNVALDSIPVTNIDIKKMTALLKGYGVDFSVVKNKQTKDFNLFFKATDTAVISAAFEQVINENDDRSVNDKTSDKEEKKPLSEQKEEAQKKAEKHNAEKAEEKANREQEKQKNRGREKDR